jgi:hypothetical protein
VPFCAHGFLPPPVTRARFFVAAVAWRALARPAMNAWKSVAAREAPLRKAAGNAIEPDDDPSAAMSGASPCGRGRQRTGRHLLALRLVLADVLARARRLGSARDTRDRPRDDALGRRGRLGGRRLLGRRGFRRSALRRLGAAFGAASERFAPAVAAVGFFAAVVFFFGSSVFAITPSSPSRHRCADRAPRRTG